MLNKKRVCHIIMMCCEQKSTLRQVSYKYAGKNT